MFFPVPAPAEDAATEVALLRLSLNTPVVAIEDLPTGPARAGIALSRDADGALRLCVAVRSLRAGSLACYGSDDDLAGRDGARIAVDAALSFAEGMGFLFDEDEVVARGDRGEVEAAGLWRELCASGAAAAAPARRGEGSPLWRRLLGRGAPTAEDEILLDEVATGSAPDAASEALPLSKFRRLAAGERPGSRLVPPAEAEREGSGLLGRF